MLCCSEHISLVFQERKNVRCFLGFFIRSKRIEGLDLANIFDRFQDLFFSLFLNCFAEKCFKRWKIFKVLSYSCRFAVVSSQGVKKFSS